MGDQGAQEQLAKALSRLADLPSEAGLPLSVEEAEATVLRPHYQLLTGSVGWLIPTDVHAEVLWQPNLSPLPGTSGLLAGLCNLRGDLVPVFQLQSVIGEPVDHWSAAIVLGKDDGRVGLAIERLPNRIQVEDSQWQVECDDSITALQSLVAGTLLLDEKRHYRLRTDRLGSSLQALASDREAFAGPRRYS